MDLSKLTPGDKAPEEITVVVEIPQGGTTKFEIDKDSGVMFVDRFLPVSMAYPVSYGFIPGTHAEDGDAVDVLLLSSQPVPVGCAIKARVIGMLEMEDEAGIDTKIIAVPMPKVDYFYKNVSAVSDLNENVKAQIKHFFDHYKDLEPGKWVKTGEFLEKDAALEVVKKGMQ